MTVAKFTITGLSVVKPDPKNLHIKFINERIIPDLTMYSHRIWCEVGKFKGWIQPNSNITIECKGVAPIFPNVIQPEKLINVDALHKVQLKHWKPPQHDIVDFKFDGAEQFTSKKTKNEYQLEIFRDQVATGEIIPSKSYAQSIGAWMQFDKSGEILIMGTSADGKPIEEVLKDTNSGHVYNLVFDNRCLKVETIGTTNKICPLDYNDFGEIYKVLEKPKKDGKDEEIQITNAPSLKESRKEAKAKFSLEIACVPVEGGGGS